MWQDIIELWDKALPFMKSFGLIALKIIILLVVGYYLSRFVAKKIKKALEPKDKMLANFLSQVAFIGSGIILIVLRPFVHGDTIEVGSLLGKVEAINLFNTTIRLPDGKLAILPNSNVSQANVINHTDISQRRVDIVFGVGYGSDINAVKMIAINVLEHNACVDLGRGYFVGMQDMGASSLDFLLRFWVDINYGLVETKAYILEALKVNLESNGIEIPFNKLDVNVFQAQDTQKQDSRDSIVYVETDAIAPRNIAQNKPIQEEQTSYNVFKAFADKIKQNLKDNGA